MELARSLAIFCIFFSPTNSYQKRATRGMSEALDRAVELTKQWQATDRDRRTKPTLTQSALREKATRPVRMELLDVERLNQLIKRIDKAWTLPKPGMPDPVGSNFQYKKTCSSIYSARNNACEQLGFGIMCFNYCFEQGAELSFVCEDASDSNFCINTGKYDGLLNKYKANAYRAKAYIHQQLTRCYSSAICDGALLNTSLLFTPMNMAESPLHLRVFRNRQHRKGTNREERTMMMRRRKMRWDGGENERKKRPMDGKKLTAEEATSTQKYVPIWQKLLVRKRMMGKEEGEMREEKRRKAERDEEEEEEEEMWLRRRFGARREDGAAGNGPWTNEKEVEMQLRNSPVEREGRRHSMEPTGFWKSFQPGKWSFQSVHYITNTG